MSLDSSRYNIFPIKYENFWNFYKKHLSTFWVVEEVNLSDDLKDWEKLSNNEKYFIKNILAFFASSDAIVNENLIINFYNEIDIPEVKQFYCIQMIIEAIHQEQYSLLLDTYISDTNEKNNLFKAIDNIDIIRKKAEWAVKWTSSGNMLNTLIPKETMNVLQNLTKSQNLNLNEKIALNFITKQRPSLAQRLLAYICVEGIFFSGSFCAIYWLKSRGILPGLCTSNQFIARDENLHVEFGIEVFNTLNLINQIDVETVHKIILEAVDLEKEFITQSLPVSLIGMNSKLMSEYIEYIADFWLVKLNCPKLFNTNNPFSFMELISVNTKENFFELDVSQYSKAGILNDENDMQIKFDCDF
jgi:ribonucleotide reductase beta subunit family protein with ferritin-like domain